MCICNSSGVTENIGHVKCGGGTGGSMGVVLDNSTCSSPGSPCSPISISDPCGCDNTIATSSGQFLFRDTLTIATVSNAAINLTLNNSGFLNSTGSSVGTSLLGNADASGNFKYAFYRAPLTTVDIVINGTPYISPASCPTATTCMPAVPTMSQWGLMILALIMHIVSIVGVLSFREIKI